MRPDPADLQHCPAFSSLRPEAAERVASWLEERHVDIGASLTPEGASGYTFFLILEGTAAVNLHGAEVAELGPGDFFGEGALLGDTGRRNASVVATTPMRVAAMFGSEFRLLERDYPEVAETIGKTMAAREAANRELEQSG